MQRLAKKKREREPVEKSGFYSSNIQRSNDKLKLKVQNIFEVEHLFKQWYYVSKQLWGEM